VAGCGRGHTGARHRSRAAPGARGAGCGGAVESKAFFLQKEAKTSYLAVANQVYKVLVSYDIWSMVTG
jgi:hypothetical protein